MRETKRGLAPVLRPASLAVLVWMTLAMIAGQGLGSRLPAQTADTEPPTVVVATPPANATGVSTVIDVQAVFSEPVLGTSISMVLTDSANVAVPSTVSYDAATATATLNPTLDLVGARTYTVTVRNAQDLAGNVMSTATWVFTTTAGFEDTTMPFTGLLDPMVVAFASDARVFVAEKSGLIKVFDTVQDATPTIVADLRTQVHNYWDRGLLGMALDPTFPASPYAYMLYTYNAVIGGLAPRWATTDGTADTCPDPPGATTNGCVVSGRLSRIDLTDGNLFDEQVLIGDWYQQFPSHSVGTLFFGPDGALYASGGEGASFNYADYGQTPGDPPSGDPVNEAGALRSQDLRTPADPATLDGTIIRIDPSSGAAFPMNPLASSSDLNARRIVAYGLRNPFRFTIRPGTRELWIGDVGSREWEEINRVVDGADMTVENFGWPCYEGSARQSGFDLHNLPVCETLYSTSPSPVLAPYFTYNHSSTVVSGEACSTGSSSIAGLAFYTGGSYPDSYDGALFFADYSRKCIWAMLPGSNGLPNPNNRVTVKASARGPVFLVRGPGGDIYYAGFDDERIHRIRYVSGNLPPTATVQASPTFGSVPLTVSFDARDSRDPEGGALTFAWDLDGDGEFDDATVAQPTFTYTQNGDYLARVRVSDPQNFADVAAVLISADNNPPVPSITMPTSSLKWRVGQTIAFSGTATDPEQGSLPATALSWTLVMQHCPSNCHSHTIQRFDGTYGGSFSAPDHEYPSYLELALTATDASGLQRRETVRLDPETVQLTFQSSPAGLQLVAGVTGQAAPFTRTVIVGSAVSVSAPSPQVLSGRHYFVSWSDGGAQSHTIVAPAVATTYTATYQKGKKP